MCNYQGIPQVWLFTLNSTNQSIHVVLTNKTMNYHTKAAPVPVWRQMDTRYGLLYRDTKQFCLFQTQDYFVYKWHAAVNILVIMFHNWQ